MHISLGSASLNLCRVIFNYGGDWFGGLIVWWRWVGGWRLMKVILLVVRWDRWVIRYWGKRISFWFEYRIVHSIRLSNCI